ncbi:MAG TPA: PspC domain-containing protein [Ignavibacteria bacterium]|nr:PspC domain-containing protein [Ignavibacteria bacterium]
MTERLYRSRTKKVIGGVAGGLGDYLNIDPVLIRVLFVIITLINGLGILLYIILWIVVQEEPYNHFSYEMGPSSDKPENETTSETQSTGTHQPIKKEGKGKTAVGIILIALGFIFLAENWFPSFRFKDIFPLAILIIGIWLVIDSLTKREKKDELR